MIKLLILLLPFTLAANDLKKACGEYVGRMFWERSLKDTEVNFADVLRGFDEASQNMPAKINDDEGFNLYLELEKQKFEKQAEANLQHSVVYLKEVASQCKEIVPGMVYVQVIQEVTTQLVSTRFKLKASRFDESPFYENNEGVIQTLDTAIPGFVRGVEGMVVGEKRILYIHPEYGYGLYDRLHPNSALRVEVEMLD